MSADIMRRYLEFCGYTVKHVQNFTDVDDKIIARAAKENTDYTTISTRYIKEFYSSVDRLNLLRAHVYPKATEEIGPILDLIKTLIERGHAYEADGDVFFAVDTFEDYGQLSGRKTDELITGTRFEVDEKKRSPLDFALWKSAKPGEPKWDSPFGEGRPGWHIECSAMALKYLGQTFDFHGGGLDLIFPHHENEKAQSECATGQPFSNYWVESGLLNTGGEKMSKSLNNFFAINDILEKFTANEIRFFLISTHYRSPMDFGEHRLMESRTAFGRISKSVVAACQLLQDNQSAANISIKNPSVPNVSDVDMAEFREAMDDDFNTAVAIANIFNLVKKLNTLVQNPNDFGEIESVLGSILGICSILGFSFETPQSPNQDILTDVMEKIISWRQQLRTGKNWAMADQIRDDLGVIGITLKDRADRTEWDVT